MPHEQEVDVRTSQEVPVPTTTSVRFGKTGVQPREVDFDAVDMTVQDFFDRMDMEIGDQQVLINGLRVQQNDRIPAGALVMITSSPSGA